MDVSTAKQRDRILRAFFEGKDWDENDEFKLKRHVVLNSSDLLPDYEFLVDDEWDVKPGHTNHGRGDPLFTDGRGAFAVVEVKYIDLDRSGSTVRNRRTKSRSKVAEQALEYSKRAYERFGPDVRVEAFSYTNEAPRPVLQEVVEGPDDTAG